MTLIAMTVFEQDVDWVYMPLEDSKMDFVRRLLAIKGEDYGLIDDDQDGAQGRMDALHLYRNELVELSKHVEESMRAPSVASDGTLIVPSLSEQRILKWVEEKAKSGRKIIFLDPLTQIDFPGLQVENEFIRSLLALAEHFKVTLVLATHTKARPGRRALDPLSIEDLQGSSLWPKLCHTVILVDAHEDRENNIYCKPKFTLGVNQKKVIHNRTISVGRARNAGGSRSRIAFHQSKKRPAFMELGVCVPKSLVDKEADHCEDWNHIEY